jgi:preprotein translocase subunit SecD
VATTTTSRPGRALLALAIALVLLFGIMAAGKLWKPKLGLDLRGGTTITLTATSLDGSSIDADKLAEAKDIISQRVNGAGIGEAEITTSGSNHIVIAVPGVNQESLVRQVGETALLRFRVVYAVAPGAAVPTPSPTPSATPSSKPSASPSTTPSKQPSAQPSGLSSATPGNGSSATPAANGRGMSDVLRAATPTPTPKPSTPATPSTPAQTTPPGQPVKGDDPLQWQPDEATQAAYAAYTCDEKKPQEFPDRPLITCDRQKQNKFLLGPAVVEGTDLSNAYAGVPQNQFSWMVFLEFTSEGGKKFAKATTFLSQKPEGQNSFAIVLDGEVMSYPSVKDPITDGKAQIEGTFSENEARDLANVLKYGALPLAFEPSSVENVSPQLGNDQLRAGILAGLIGLSIVVLYSFLYYRGLGIVVVASLAVAAALVYSSVVLLGEALGFTLTLAGIAGLIVAIGITADSFVVFFERLRDEIRDGRSLRSAVETGWARARHTIIAADSITLLAAIVLYMLAVGGIKGFAFALGLTTVIDLIVVFLFTKPLVTVLARTKFFGHGHPLSGLDPKHLGVERLPGQMGPWRRPTTVAGGKA